MRTERRLMAPARADRARRAHTLTRTVIVAGALALGGGVVATAQDGSPTASPGATAATPLTVGLGYIPNVQFAQFYRAELAGYYDEAGLDVTFQNKIDPELIVLLGQGAVDVGMADGTSIIAAVSQKHPGRLRHDRLRPFPERRLRARGQRHPDRRRPRRQAHRHPWPVRVVVGHAPGVACVGGPDAR